MLHAASQDLPGLVSRAGAPRLFDTELAARLLGMPRVGLAAVVAENLGLGLAKEHSAVDWSTRPLPGAWLRYAALDVEVLVELREVLAERLATPGRLEWARQEFEPVRTAPPPPPRVDPWRRTSGLHAVRSARGLAVARALWHARDGLAPPGHLARSGPAGRRNRRRRAGPARSVAELVGSAVRGQGHPPRATQWHAAVARPRAARE